MHHPSILDSGLEIVAHFGLVPQPLPELINAALSILYVLGLLLLFADAQKFEHCEEAEGKVTARSEF